MRHTLSVLSFALLLLPALASADTFVGYVYGAPDAVYTRTARSELSFATQTQITVERRYRKRVYVYGYDGTCPSDSKGNRNPCMHWETRHYNEFDHYEKAAIRAEFDRNTLLPGEEELVKLRWSNFKATVVIEGARAEYTIPVVDAQFNQTAVVSITTGERERTRVPNTLAIALSADGAKLLVTDSARSEASSDMAAQYHIAVKEDRLIDASLLSLDITDLGASGLLIDFAERDIALEDEKSYYLTAKLKRPGAVAYSGKWSDDIVVHFSKTATGLELGQVEAPDNIEDSGLCGTVVSPRQSAFFALSLLGFCVWMVVQRPKNASAKR